MFRVLIKADPVYLTFMNPICAYAAGQQFIEWSEEILPTMDSFEGPIYIYDIDVPKDPIQIDDYLYPSVLNAYGYSNNTNYLWTINGNGEAVKVNVTWGWLGSYNNYIVFENTDKVYCKYKYEPVRKALGSQYMKYAGEPGKEIVKFGKTFNVGRPAGSEVCERFDSYITTRHREEGVTFAYGGGDGGVGHKWWTPALDRENWRKIENRLST